MKTGFPETYVPLNVRTQYGGGLAKVRELVRKARQMGLPALAVADDVAGAGEFIEACTTQKGAFEGLPPIKPIVGSMFAVDAHGGTVCCYAKNRRGYRNLCKLITDLVAGSPAAKAYRKWGRQLICVTGYRGSVLAKAIEAGDAEGATRIVGTYKKTFGDDLYLTASRYHCAECGKFRQEDVAASERIHFRIRRLAEEFAIRFVASCPVRFVNAEDELAYRLFKQIEPGAPFDDHESCEAAAWFLPTPGQMLRRYGGDRESLAATCELADKVDGYNLAGIAGALTIPGWAKDGVADERLARIVNSLAHDRWGRKLPAVVEVRMQRELDAFRRAGRSEFVLLVLTATQILRDSGVEIGTGWSEGNASLVCYILGLTQINPLEHDLPFEIFMNDGSRAPNIVLEVSTEGPNVLRDGLAARFGIDHVAHLSNRVAVSPQQVALAVCAKGEVKSKRCDRLIGKLSARSKVFTARRGIKWDGGGCAALAKAVQSKDLRLSYLANMILKIYGSAKECGVHCCGLVVCPSGLTNVTPLVDMCLPERENPQHVKLAMLGRYEFEGTGAFVLDVIGCSALDLRRGCVELVKKRTGEDLDINAVPLDDEKTLEMFRRARTDGIPYFEEEAVKEMLGQGRPLRFSDLVLIKALGDPRFGGNRRQVLDRMASRASSETSAVQPEPRLEAMCVGRVFIAYQLGYLKAHFPREFKFAATSSCCKTGCPHPAGI